MAKPAKRPGTGTESTPTAPAEEPASKLPPDAELFLNIYVANGFNATAAYKAVKPNAPDGSARVLASRLLTKVHIKARLAELVEDRWSGLHMTGNEVLGRVAMDARADVRLLYDCKGRMLPPNEWPDEIANSVESVEVRPDGAVKVKLASKVASRRTILEITGKVKGAGDSIDELANALRETLEANAKATAAKDGKA